MSAAPLPRPAAEPSESVGTTAAGAAAPVASLVAGSQPPPDESPADAEGWALLDALRRKLDDQGSAQRKTSSQVGQLADSIAGLVAEQRRRSRWANMNSFVAYLIFTVVVGAAFFALYRSRASELLAARDIARTERDTATKRANDAAAKIALRESTDTKAWEVYQLLDAGKRVEATTKLGAIEASLSKTERAVLAARAHETQVMEVEAALKAATNAFKAGHYSDVVKPLEAALVMESRGARAAEAHYLLGVAYAKANDLPKAISHLRAAVDGDTEHDDARFQLASALDRSGLNAKARAEYDQFATAHPQLGLAVYAMRRSATLARMPATSPMVNGVAPGSLPMAPPTINTAPAASPRKAPTVPKPAGVAPVPAQTAPQTAPQPGPNARTAPTTGT